MRVLLGRGGLLVEHLDDNAPCRCGVSELGEHVDTDGQPTAVRVSRPRVFPR
jgi:hypothetical protein